MALGRVEVDRNYVRDVCVQLSVLRVMHKMLSDRVVRDKRRLKDVQVCPTTHTHILRHTSCRRSRPD